jgi:predicted nucleotidyltransferase
MDTPQLPQAIASLIDHLATLPNVVAVMLGGSRAQGTETADSDWDLGVYYRDEFDPEGLQHLEGTIAPPGDWGRIMNGGAWLNLDGLKVDVHYRNLDEVRHWIREAQDGRFEVDGLLGYLAGIPTYFLAAEVALGKVVAGSLDEVVEYPDQLAQQGAARWRDHARFSLDHARMRAARGDLAGVTGHLARAFVEVAHARLCEAHEWTVNEKDILERSELTHLNQILTALNTDPVTLTQRVMQARALLLD